MTSEHRNRVFVVLFLYTLAFGASTACARLYVSPQGKDSWTGKLAAPNANGTDGPFKTIGRARDAIRRFKENGQAPDRGIEVFLRAGTYAIGETIRFTATDGGSADAPVRYMAYRDEKVRLIGGREVSGFGPVDDADVRSRLSESARENVVQVNLKESGVTDFGRLRPRGFGRPMYPAALELFFDGRPMQLARWPNEGWAKIAAVPKDTEDRFIYEGNRPGSWTDADDIWLHGYWNKDWADTYESVASIDTEKKLIITHPPHGAYGYTKGKRYYALNILEELDAPGEWYLDRKTGILYFWPPSPVEESKAYVSVLEEPMIALENVEHLRIEGFVFEATRGRALEIHGGADCVIADCMFRNIGNIAVDIDGGTRNGVQGCLIYNTGDGGVVISGGDRKTLTPAGNFARNNHIHHYSRWVRTYRPAVRLSGVGNHIAHCLIHDAPHTGVLFGGNNHVLEFNEIHNVCHETGDVGAFYTGRNWTTRGTVIRYNYFHDIHGPYTHGAMSVYLDDAASGTTIYGNVFHKASRAAFIGGGRDNIVENNIFVECHPAVHIDARGLGWAKGHIAKGGGWRMYDKLRDMQYDKPPYSTRYPALARILEGDPAVPMGNVVRRNICRGGRWMDLQGVKKEWVIIEDNLVDSDETGFVDVKGGNFHFKDPDPARRIGFKMIPLEQIGLEHSQR